MVPPHIEDTFLKKGQRFQDYMFYPRFLLNMDLSETAKLIYILLLDRGKLSSTRSEWSDEEGNVFVIFTLSELAALSHKTTRTVSTALNELEKADLLLREKQGIGKHRRIFLKLKAQHASPTIEENFTRTSEKNFTRTSEENFYPRKKKSSTLVGRKLPPYISNNNINNNYINNNFRNKYDPYYFEEGESL